MLISFKLIFYCELIALAAALWAWKQLIPSYLKLLPVLLLVICAGEWLAFLLPLRGPDNIEFYNYFSPIQFLIYNRIYYKALPAKGPRGFILLASVLLIIVTVLYPFFSQNDISFNVLGYCIGVLTLSIEAIMYIYAVLNSDRVLGMFRDLLFYVSFGALMYYLISLPFYSMRNWMAQQFYDSLFVSYYQISIVLNCIMYLLFAFAFLWVKKK